MKQRGSEIARGLLFSNLVEVGRDTDDLVIARSHLLNPQVAQIYIIQIIGDAQLLHLAGVAIEPTLFDRSGNRTKGSSITVATTGALVNISPVFPRHFGLA
jgi:hypothetical protein